MVADKSYHLFIFYVEWWGRNQFTRNPVRTKKENLEKILQNNVWI